MNNILEEVEMIVKKNWFARLLDMNDTTVSASTVFMIILTFIGCFLLIVPAIILLVEVYYNHTITTDLSGMAAYVGAVGVIFTSAGITKAWATWSNYKYNSTIVNSQPQTDINFEELKED